MDIERCKELLKNEELQDYLMNSKSKWFFERYLYFVKVLGKDCKYVNSCIKLMTEDIDGFYSRR